jgi:hypothetical protein
LEHIELPKARDAGTPDYWHQWEAANRAWLNALPNATLNKWAIATVRKADDDMKAETRQDNRQRQQSSRAARAD